jgi:hypothetical protein
MVTFLALTHTGARSRRNPTAFRGLSVSWLDSVFDDYARIKRLAFG